MLVVFNISGVLANSANHGIVLLQVSIFVYTTICPNSEGHRVAQRVLETFESVTAI